MKGLENLYIEGTKDTPKVEFSSNSLFIRGRSTIPHPEKFYGSIIESMDSYKNDFKLVLGLEYFNVSSAKCLMDLFESYKNSADPKVSWRYEKDDEDSFEAGEEFKEMYEGEIAFTIQALK